MGTKATEMSAYKIKTMFASSKDADPFRNFIIATFLREVRHTNQWFLDIDQDAYYSFFGKVIETLIAQNDALVKIAVILDDPNDTAVGWSLYNGDTLHFIFVKKDVRNQGIGQTLMPTTIKRFTQLTKAARIIWKKNYHYLKFDPLT